MLKKWVRAGVLLAALALLCCLGAGAAEPVAADYQGPVVRNTTEAFPIFASPFSGPTLVWSDEGAFEDGAYEGYYAQLDGVSQRFYRQLQTVLADPATAFTAANKTTYNAGTDASPVNLPAYIINVPYPPEVTFPSATASTQKAAEAQLGAMVYRHVLPALDALGRDHPEMPWLNAHWGISGGFSMSGFVSGGQYTLFVVTDDPEKPFQLLLINPSTTVLNGCRSGAFQAAVDTAINTLDQNARYGLAGPDKTTLDKVRAIHDFLCRQIVYAGDGDSTTALDQNAYSALVSPYKTVCAGYTASTKLLCDHYGIPCVNVTGLGGERHAWNYVQMDDGAWYAVDCTWDDMAGGEPIYDFFLKGSTAAVPYGGGTSGVIPFPQSHIETPTWSNYTVMPYPGLSEDDYLGYVLSAAPTARATYGSSYSAVSFTGGEVRQSANAAAVTGGKWFAGDWTDKDRAKRTIPAQTDYPATLELPVFFSQNPAFDPVHIYSDPLDYPVTATATVTVDKAPLTIQKADLTGDTVTAVTFGGLKNGESLTLGTDYTAVAVPNGNYHNVTVTLLDTPLTGNYVLETPTFNTSRNNSTAAPTGASVTPSRLDLAVGQSQRVQFTFTPTGSLQPAVTWTTSDPGVATVDATGLVTAVGVGTAQLTIAPDGFRTSSIPITVTAAPAPTGLTLSETTVHLTLGKDKTHQLSAAILPAGATGVVKWSSDLQRVATVSGTGLVTPKATGFAVITAALYADASAAKPIATTQCMVSVFANDVPATGVSLDKSVLAINAGKTYQLTYTLRPTGVTDPSVSWTSSDPAVATVDATGLVTARAKGSATVTLSTATPGVSARCDVTVLVQVSAVTLSAHTLDLVEGDDAVLTAAVTPADSSYPTVTWTSSKPEVATVDAAGHVTAVGPGTATIIATAGSKTAQKSDSCTVTVAAEDFTVQAVDVGFDPAAYGYAQPAAKALTILSRGNRPATVSSVAVSDPEAFILSGSGGTVPAGGVFMGYTLRPAAGLGAGTHTATITVTYHGGERATAKVTFTVLRSDADYGPGALAVTNAGVVSDTFTYGDVLQLTFLPRPAAALMAAAPANQAALYLGDVLLAGPGDADAEGKYVLRYDTAQGLVPLGDRVLTFRYGGSADLKAGGVEVPVRLEAKALEADMVALDLPAGGYVYDGGAKTPAVNVTHGDRTLGEKDYTLTYRDNRNAGTATVAVTGQGWYTGTVERTFPITKQANKAVSVTARQVPWDVTAPQSLDLAPAVAELALDSDAPVYGAATVTGGGAYLQGEPTVGPDGLLTFALAGLVETPGSVVLSVPVTGLGNYTSVDVTVTVPVVEDTEVTVDLSGLVLTDRVYNGQSLAYAGQAAGTCSGEAYSGAFTYTWQDAQGSDLSAPPVDAGTYRLLVRTATPGFQGQGSKPVTITPAPVAVTAADQRVNYGEDIARGVGQATASGLLAGHRLGDVTLTADGQGAILPSAAAVVDAQGRDVTGNYALTYLPGALTVLEPQVTVAQGPVWDGARSVVTLNVAPVGLLDRPGVLVFAARYADGAMVEVVRGDAAGDSVTFAADLTAQTGWKLFFLEETLAPLCGAVVVG